MSAKIDLTARTFGRWRVLGPSPERDGRRCVIWRCLCDPVMGGCGAESLVSGAHLRQGTSSGCRACAARSQWTADPRMMAAARRNSLHVWPKVCPTCGLSFAGTTRQVYCSRVCRPRTRPSPGGAN